MAVILALLQVMDVVGESNRILAATGAGETDLWRYASLRLPVLLSQFLPFTVLIAALVTFGTFAATGQVVVMRALGLSPHQILAPMLAVGALCGAFHFAWNESVAIPAAARLATWQAAGYGVIGSAPPGPGRPTWEATAAGFVRARVSPGNGGIKLEDVAIFKAAAGQLTNIILAKEGFLGDHGVGYLHDRRAIKFVGSDGAVHADRMSDVHPQQFLYRAVPAEESTFTGLRQSIHAATDAGRETGALDAELQHRLARPLASFLMPLLGSLAAFGLARTNTVLVRASASLAVGFGYLIFDELIMSMGRAEALPPALAAWSASLLFLLIGEILVFRSEQ